jgi:hypothetical protein
LYLPRDAAPPANIVKVQGGGGDMGGNFQDNFRSRSRSSGVVSPERAAVDRDRDRFVGRDRFERRSVARFSDDRFRGDRFERRGSYAYYNGHRGYRYHRHGYRRHNGYWFPLAAFATGALIAGSIAAAPPPAVVYASPNPHIDWCRAHYRSYNPHDNTFQPYHGPRQYCRSPYG